MSIKSWWQGDTRVEPFMEPVNEALDRSGLKGEKRTDVYNRAYEAIHAAIIQYGEDPEIQKILNMSSEEIHAEMLAELGTEEAVSEAVDRTKRVIKDAISKGMGINK